MVYVCVLFTSWVEAIETEVFVLCLVFLLSGSLLERFCKIAQAAFAALPGGDMRMLKLVVDAEAVVCEPSPTSNMSLIWRAADLG